MELHIRIAHPRAAANETAGLEMIAGSQPVVAQQPARADERAAPQRHVRVQRDRLTARDLKVELEVILEILTHPREIVDDLDTEGGELGPRTDARELQQLRRVDGTGAQDDFAPRARLLCGTSP